MFQHERAIRPALAGLVVLCFLMPFVKISCGGQPIASMSGIDLAFGNRPGVSNMFTDQMAAGFSDHMKEALNTPDGQRFAQPYKVDTTDTAGIEFVDAEPDTAMAAGTNPQSGPGFPSASTPGSKSEPFTAAALALMVVGLLASFGTSRKPMIVSALSAGLAAIALFVLKSRFTSDLPPEAAGIIAIEWGTAFWVALVGAGCLAAYTAKLLAEIGKEDSRPRLVIQSYSDHRSVSSGTR